MYNLSHSQMAMEGYKLPQYKKWNIAYICSFFLTTSALWTSSFMLSRLQIQVRHYGQTDQLMKTVPLIPNAKQTGQMFNSKPHTIMQHGLNMHSKFVVLWQKIASPKESLLKKK